MSIRLTPMTWFVILVLVAVGLVLGLPLDPHIVEQLHTSEAVYRLSMVMLLLPGVLIWYAAFYAFAKLREYSRPLRDTKDGAGFYKITIGMGILAFSLVVPVIVSLILNSIAIRYPALKAASVIINNYLDLFPGLVAFLLLYNGARQLASTVHDRAQTIDLRWHATWFLLLSVIFSYLAIENDYRGHTYYLNLFLLVATFIVPYLYGWMVGLLSAYELRVYAKTVKGLLYRRAVRQFSNGIALAVTGSIAFQFVNVTIEQRIVGSLGSILLVDYALLAIVAAGLLLMALGTRKLKLIEEI